MLLAWKTPTAAAVAPEHRGAIANPMGAVRDGVCAKCSSRRRAARTVRTVGSIHASVVRATVVAVPSSFRGITTTVSFRKITAGTKIFYLRTPIGLQLIRPWRGLAVFGFGSMEARATWRAARFASRRHTTSLQANNLYARPMLVRIASMV